MLDNNMVVVVIVFLITLFILNIIRFCFLKFLNWSEPKYFYWYLFVLSWIVAFLVGWVFLK